MFNQIAKIAITGVFLAACLPAQSGCPGVSHTPGTWPFSSVFAWNYYTRGGSFISPADAPWLVGAGAYCGPPPLSTYLGNNEIAVTSGASINCNEWQYRLSQDGGTLPGEYTVYTHGRWVALGAFSPEEEWCSLTTCNAAGATIMNYDHYGNCGIL
jgi:hypothetical protein